jgi:hypothetical protein
MCAITPGSFHHGICKVVEINNNVHKKKPKKKSSLQNPPLRRTAPTLWVGIFLFYNCFYNGRETYFIVHNTRVLCCGSSHLESVETVCDMSPKPIEYLVVGLVQQENNQHYLGSPGVYPCWHLT